MLNLVTPTDSAWIARALGALPELLLDHAHCEKKAAGTAIQLIFRYPQHGFLLAPLAALAREELGHFEQVLALMESRGLAFGRQRPSPYAGRLRQTVRAGEPERLIDTLLCCALIEARSCERMSLLADALQTFAVISELGLLLGQCRVNALTRLACGFQLALGLQLAPDERARQRFLVGRETDVELILNGGKRRGGLRHAREALLSFDVEALYALLRCFDSLFHLPNRLLQQQFRLFNAIEHGVEIRRKQSRNPIDQCHDCLLVELIGV